MKRVLISEELYQLLVAYHLHDDTSSSKQIKKELEKKESARALHEIYTKSKTASTEEEKEQARKEHLDQKGVPESFRW